MNERVTRLADVTGLNVGNRIGESAKWFRAGRDGRRATMARPFLDAVLCMYDTYVPNKTISVPDDVVPIIDNLGVPFSTWVADQLRHHAATQPGVAFSQQLLADAELARTKPPTAAESLQAMERMERSAPW